MKPALLLIGLSAAPLLPATAVTPAPPCTLWHDGNVSRPTHVYAIRVPDPYFDGQQRLRIVCLSEALVVAELSRAEVSQEAMQLGSTTEGFRVEIDADGEVVFVEVSMGGTREQYSGKLSIAFEGAEEDGEIVGRIATETPLGAEDGGTGWSLEARVRADLVEAQ